jgi:transposase-like protein
MPRSAPPLAVSPAERIIVEAVAASEEIPENVKKRARVVLLAADGAANCTIAREVSLARPRVLYWRQRFAKQGIRGLWDLEGVRPQDRISEAAEQAIVFDCLYRPRLSGDVCVEQMLVDSSLNWNVRNLARRHGVSPATVQRIWKKHGIRMQRYGKVDRGVDLEELKISQDPLFGITVYAIAGLFYETIPVLAFCSQERPFSELALSSISTEARLEIVDDLVARFRNLDQRFPCESFKALNKFPNFIADIQAKPRHAGAQLHLLAAWQMPPTFRDWLEQRCVQVHYAPWPTLRGRWIDLAERWLRVIAGWPMQTSFIASLDQLCEILRRLPKEGVPETLIVC